MQLKNPHPHLLTTDSAQTHHLEKWSQPECCCQVIFPFCAHANASLWPRTGEARRRLWIKYAQFRRHQSCHNSVSLLMFLLQAAVLFSAWLQTGALHDLCLSRYHRNFQERWEERNTYMNKPFVQYLQDWHTYTHLLSAISPFCEK